jgi:hypothetical protein
MGEVRWQHSGHRLVLPVAVLPSIAAENANAIEVVDALIDTGRPGPVYALTLRQRFKYRPAESAA